MHLKIERLYFVNFVNIDVVNICTVRVCSDLYMITAGVCCMNSVLFCMPVCIDLVVHCFAEQSHHYYCVCVDIVIYVLLSSVLLFYLMYDVSS